MLELSQSVYAFSREQPPAGRAAPGEAVRFLTQDCFAGQIRTEADRVEHLDFTHTNPAAGPLWVEGAMPGDALAVEIVEIEVAEQGVIATMEGGGALWPSCELRTRVIPIRGGFALFQGTRFPIDPMIGVIGTAPAGEPVPTGYSFPCGGNMDSRKIRKGATVYLPVQVEGALLAMGDLHAAMGDGEVCETGVEIAGAVTVRLGLVKAFPMRWPVTETPRHWYVNTNGRDCDAAIRRGYQELQRLVMAATGWDATDAALYLSARARVEANQAVLDEVETDGEGPTFRVGLPKAEGMPRLVP